MSPSGHSHSSHSSSRSSSHSSSRSSSGRSSSRSSSSRSHSSSSHSSSYRGSGSRSYSSAGSTAYRQTTPLRARTHQPTNYRFGSTHPTYTYQCRRHDYVFYPIDWRDESTNTVYQKGYYDEQGNRYDNLILKNNERYENVPMHCPYCDSTAVRDLTDDTQTMSCEHCGGNMIIDAILDEKADVSAGAAYTNQAAYSGNTPRTAAPRKKWPFIVVGAIIASIYVLPMLTAACLAPFAGVSKYFTNKINNSTVVQQTTQQTTQTQTTQQTTEEYVDNPDIFGRELYLIKTADGCIFGDSSDYDLFLVWSDYDESYYNSDSDCYVWFNTDMDPALWQYWYEGISSDYGEYGWMEYENGDWYIEVGEGEWESVDLSGYGDRIWHFADPNATEYWTN